MHLHERKQECIEPQAEVLRPTRAFAALPVEPSPVAIDAANELSHAASDLWSKLHWLADWTREIEELRRVAMRVAGNVIELLPRGAR